MDKAGPDQLLRQLSAVDQEVHKSRTQPSSCDRPNFYWIFKDIEFERWQSTHASGPEVLWLSGPAECRISDASSRIVDLAKKTHSALYFFCSTAPMNIPIAITFACTIICQLARCSPQLKKKVVMTFLHTLLDRIPGDEPHSNLGGSLFNAGDSAEAVAKKILKASSSETYWGALRAAMDIEQEQGLSLIIDGLEKTENQFIRELDRFIEHLRERPSTTKVLLTSRPQTAIGEIFGPLPCIEYDRERKGLACFISYSPNIQVS